MSENTFPILLIVLDLCASVNYAWSGDSGRAVYWTAAAVITYAATFMIGH